MIKFQYIIHKETGTVIKYEDWKEKLETDNIIKWKDKDLNGTWAYKPKNILFSDDFEIIYNSEFTALKLELIKESLEYSLDEYLINCNGYDVIKEIRTLLNEKYILKDKYGIDI